jgi:hypothetical protein
MPISYRIDSEHNIILVEADGVLTTEDHLAFRAQLVADSQFGPNMKELADFRSVERQELSTDGYQRFINQEIQLRPLFKNYRRAIVTHSDLHFGFTRKFIAEMGDADSNTRVFRDLQEAEAWLFGEEEP